LALSKPSDLRGGGRKGFAQGGIGIVPCGGCFFCRDADSIGARKAIEFGGVTQKSAVPLAPNIGNDARYDGQDGVERRATAPLEGGEEVCSL
jgi:hypothetical protein